MYYSLMKENRSETGRKSIGVLALVGMYILNKYMYLNMYIFMYIHAHVTHWHIFFYFHIMTCNYYVCV